MPFHAHHLLEGFGRQLSIGKAPGKHSPGNGQCFIWVGALSHLVLQVASVGGGDKTGSIKQQAVFADPAD